MIDWKAVDRLIQAIDWKPKSREHIWKKVIGVSEQGNYMIAQAVRGAASNFNYWDCDGKINWGLHSSRDWYAVIRYEKDINTLNLAPQRKAILHATNVFLADCNLPEEIRTINWWDRLTLVFGNDPLRKREVLAWITLTDLGWENLPCPNKGCIDYNIILLFRYNKIITGYEGNKFDLNEETKIRKECLQIVEYILEKRDDLNVSSLDECLYMSGKGVRKKPREEWDPYFCYRFGCFYY